MNTFTFTINLVIGLLTFFLLRWTLKKLVKSDRLRIGLTCLGTIIFTPILYLGLVEAFFSILFYQPTRDFGLEVWLADKSKRYEMRDDLVESGILKSKNKKEITDLIGLPDFGSDSTDTWNYALGTSQAGLGWQYNYLLVTFNNDRVVKVEKQEFED